jgi:hypothetical protein
MIMVFHFTEVILHTGGWKGVALVVILLPAYIMIFLLTDSLKGIYMRKYAISNSSSGE